MGDSFEKRGVIERHLNLPKYPPVGLENVEHTDEYGTEKFGPWTHGNIFYWFIRLFILTDPTSTEAPLKIRQDILKHSMALVNDDGRIVAGALREAISPPTDENKEIRPNDIFLSAVLSLVQTIHDFFGRGDNNLSVLSDKYPEFRDAYHKGKVAYASVIARIDDSLPKGHTFELTASTVEHFQALGFKYLITGATNQWTGAAFEVLNGVRVQYQPFLTEKLVPESNIPVEGIVTSSDGYISYKDSGNMVYVVRLS